MYYKDLGWKLINKNKTGGLGASQKDFCKYTKKFCIDLAQKYKKIHDFYKDYPGIYLVIRKNKWAKDVFRHINEKHFIVVFKDDGNYYGLYDNVKDVGEKLLLNQVKIHACLNKHSRSKRVKNFMFMRYEEWLSLNSPNKIKKFTSQNKEVIMLDKNNVFIKNYISLNEAARDIKKERGVSTIMRVCQGKRKSAYGYKWMYKEEYNKLNN